MWVLAKRCIELKRCDRWLLDLMHVLLSLLELLVENVWVVNNNCYSLIWKWIALDIYQASKRRGKYLPLFTDTEVNNCFSIIPNQWIASNKNKFYQSKLNWKGDYSHTHHFDLLPKSRYHGISRAWVANQSAWKWIFTGLLVSTNNGYPLICFVISDLVKQQMPAWMYLQSFWRNPQRYESVVFLAWHLHLQRHFSPGVFVIFNLCGQDSSPFCFCTSKLKEVRSNLTKKNLTKMSKINKQTNY